ncbi:MAG: putative glutathione S-transferase-related transrane protein [Haloplasmataceae bacterium]|jgi:uncharacterized protein YndB with AHSA1/START domain|nr:putative glutathione S-transferase-related transrane protein [Haloplasmataceae bacterium]
MKLNSETIISAEAGKQDIVVKKVLDAPRELVFKAYTDLELYTKWYGPREATITIDKFEPVNGGVWRYIYHNQRGNEYTFYGVYHKVVKDEIIINTFEFEGPGSFVTLQTTIFEELPNNKTSLTAKSLFESVELRDSEVKYGMNGITDTYERLEEVLKNLKK